MPDPCPLSIARSNCSPFWCAISKVWPEFRLHTAWSVGDGSIIKFWEDVWIPVLGSLRTHATPSVTFDDSLTVSEMVTVSRTTFAHLLFAHLFVDHGTSSLQQWSNIFEREKYDLFSGNPDRTLFYSPNEGWVCLNTNSAVLTINEKAPARGIFRDCMGNFLFAYNKDLGFSSFLSAELWGICHGLLLAWANGFEWVLVQTDNSNAYHLFLRASVDSPFS
ncbi:hypothetical protein F3Y22_tig00117010pilonHSYRG00022 [Hibiscus syriacus]|uniref:RNase H type-1 domain-containing protein n=1 Tax=Hibiscus syriacus TaxID=106335 RepID=A0A6A2XCG5_HIBSY|nr:hypothetical protein F3Y22_tig00117010pilonHSYRG00022 [Hibiscus syriacus]